MHFETLKNKYWKIIIGVVVIVLIGATVILTTSKAKYRTTQSIPLVRGKINWKPYDFKMMAMYQEDDSGEYVEIETMPSSGYAINEEKSYCYTTSSSEIDTNAKLYTDEKGQHVFANLSKNSKCYLYFDVEKNLTMVELLSNYTISERTSFSAVYTDTTTNTLFKAQDDDGTSYYYAGNPTDNYVKFAGYYWRIIRINGDKSIRLIYQGESVAATGTDAQIGTSAFNTNSNDNMYVGYMYTANQVHGLGTSSTVKGTLDNWFASNLGGYISYLDYNAGFCGDRTPYTREGGPEYYTYTAGGGTGTTNTYYGDYVRYYNNGTPVLTCASSEDLYTTENSKKGNKTLTYPIGLINMNEVWYAGGYQANNTSYYLYTGRRYWTMSPGGINTNVAYMLEVNSTGSLQQSGSVGSSSIGVRPVINLKVGTLFKPDSLGTMVSPYIVVGAE